MSDIEGFVLGQCEIYCEPVRAGAKLAAQTGCPRELERQATAHIARAGLSCIVEPWCETHVTIWIFKYPFVRKLIEEINADAPVTALRVWAMGKLFGYSDVEIGRYLGEHGLV